MWVTLLVCWDSRLTLRRDSLRSHHQGIVDFTENRRLTCVARVGDVDHHAPPAEANLGPSVVKRTALLTVTTETNTHVWTMCYWVKESLVVSSHSHSWNILVVFWDYLLYSFAIDWGSHWSVSQTEEGQTRLFTEPPSTCGVRPVAAWITSMTEPSPQSTWTGSGGFLLQRVRCRRCCAFTARPAGNTA